MAEEPLTIRGISWRQTFPFINLFRAFRVAVHPSKIVLALIALILLYVGGNVLDMVWAVQYRAIPDEAQRYDQFSAHSKPGEKFCDVRSLYRDQLEAGYAQQLLAYKLEPDLAAATKAAHSGSDLAALKDKILEKRRQTVAEADAAHIKAMTTGAPKADVDHEYHAAVRTAFAAASTEYTAASSIKNFGLFDVYFDFEANQVSMAVRGVRTGNWFGQDTGLSQGVDDVNVLGSSASPGVIQSIIRFFTVAPIWLLTQHPLYFALFGLLFLALWSVFGGAICRIAAVHVARDEKLSIRSALRFSGRKFLSFMFAPIIPLMIVVGIGLLITAGGALANIPLIGPIIVGLFFVVALAAGFVMALVLLGLIGGFNLMYPTVAVEGSDSFDAISRSFSYLYARPWRLAFYTVVSVVYGAATYLFVRMFIYLMLVLTHKFGSMAVLMSAPSTAPLWSSLWPSPVTGARLTYDIDTLSLSFTQEIGARLIWLWVHLAISILGAFAVCFYFSSNTIIYYLMRREVDATDIDDVYLEQVDDEFADPINADAPEVPVATAPITLAPTEGADSDIAPPT